MKNKTLQVADNLQERIPYSSRFPALSICSDHFDDYFQREWGCHWHDEFEFAVVREGVAAFTVYDGQRNETVELSPGDGIFIASGYLHSAMGMKSHTVLDGFALPVNFFDISFFESMIHRELHPMIKAGIVSVTLRAAVPGDQPLLSAIREVCSISEHEVAYELHFIETVCKVWRLLMIHVEHERGTAVTSSQEQRTKEMLSFIHAHFAEHITIDDLTKAAAISRSECFRCFQAILGKSPVEYLTEYRLSMATTMLANSDRTLSEISQLCGFYSPSYFGKVFRERCGATPKQYREWAARSVGF